MILSLSPDIIFLVGQDGTLYRQAFVKLSGVAYSLCVKIAKDLNIRPMGLGFFLLQLISHYTLINSVRVIFCCRFTPVMR